MRILIVDDDPMAMEILRRAVVRGGHEVRTASNGQEALALLRSCDYRLVISDWEMPEMDGLELCQAIRRMASGGYIYVVLLTSHDAAAERVRGLSAGADDFITKPFNPAELELRIRIAERILSLETRDVTIFAMAKLAESRDPETGAHIERVQNYSRVLAQHLAGLAPYREQVDAEFIRLIYCTSPLHDIGKVGIPDAVLLKPGRLTAEEFRIMQHHTVLGAQTIDAALERFPGAQFLQMARDIAATHHERWNGKGYPQGLSGERIPLAGRIVALADVYDALTSKRVYKDAYPHAVARDMIVRERGEHFDPAIVEAFLATEEQFIQVYCQYNQVEAAAA